MGATRLTASPTIRARPCVLMGCHVAFPKGAARDASGVAQLTKAERRFAAGAGRRMSIVVPGGARSAIKNWLRGETSLPVAKPTGARNRGHLARTGRTRNLAVKPSRTLAD